MSLTADCGTIYAVPGSEALARVVVASEAIADARSPILHRDLQSKSAPLAAPLIASEPLWRLARLAMSSERCGGAERVGVGAGTGVGGGRSVAAGDRGAVGDQSSDGRAARGGGRAAALPACPAGLAVGSARAGA